MRIGLITDIHANIAALEAVLGALDRAGVDQIVCLGDIVGYGADPEACCNRVRERAQLTLLGNHDAGICGRIDPLYYHQSVRQVINWHRRAVSPENREWLRALPHEVVDEVASAAYCHASPINPEAFEYLTSSEGATLAARSREDLRGVRAVFFGHSHLPRCFQVDADLRASCIAIEGVVQLQPGCQYFVSVPSVGQPRDFDCRAGGGIYDTGIGAFEFVRVDYDFEAAADKIRAAHYPREFADRLSRGV